MRAERFFLLFFRYLRVLDRQSEVVQFKWRNQSYEETDYRFLGGHVGFQNLVIEGLRLGRGLMRFVVSCQLFIKLSFLLAPE
jgi:hypothetical protein